MAIGKTNAGGGGAALNFKVVPGLTQPGTASENTIWVKTEKIGVWYFSATQPEGLQEWDVWFQTGTESDIEFNALRKNGLQVYPLSAKQMVSGILVDVEAKSYQNGKWVDLWDGITYYNAGNEWTAQTGGWDVSAHGVHGGTASKKGTHIEIGTTKGSMGGGATVTHNKVNLLEKTQLIVYLTADDPVTIGISPNNISSYKGGSDIAFTAKKTATPVSSVTAFSLPIDGNSIGSGYIAVQAWSCMCNIYKVELI